MSLMFLPLIVLLPVVAYLMRRGVLRVWAQPGRVTVTVTDSGPGPTDPRAGPVPAQLPTDSAAGPSTGPALGLWLIHQLVDVTRRSDPDGYTVGSPQPTRIADQKRASAVDVVPPVTIRRDKFGRDS